jgi:hypothetical protein
LIGWTIQCDLSDLTWLVIGHLLAGSGDEETGHG